MPEGRVRWFDAAKGYGFIEPPEAGEADVFVHQTAIEGAGYRFLREGEWVSYEMRETAKGKQAINVRCVRCLGRKGSSPAQGGSEKGVIPPANQGRLRPPQGR